MGKCLDICRNLLAFPRYLVRWFFCCSADADPEQIGH